MLIGLTGNFGTGKSTVLEMFRKAGARAIDADQIVQTLYSRQEIKDAVASLLGDILDPNGDIDKGKIANIIFSNAEMRERLERLIHPFVISIIKEFAAKHEGEPVFAEIPLLFEGAYEDLVDRIIVTTCPVDRLRERLLEKGVSSSEIEKRLSCQIPDTDKVSRADFVINTNKALDVIDNEVRTIYSALIERIRKGHAPDQSS